MRLPLAALPAAVVALALAGCGRAPAVSPPIAYLADAAAAPAPVQAGPHPAAPARDWMPAAPQTGRFEEAGPASTAAQPPEPEPQSEPEAEQLADSGLASTYGQGDGFQGARTACGQRFDTNLVQLAHKTLPCGTRVRVEDVATGNSVVAEVTDRGPYVRGRVVDLSWAAFRQLDPSGPGLRQVNVYVLTNEA